MDNPFFTYSPIVRRPPLRLPQGKRIAVWFALNLEHYEYGKPALSLAPFTAGLTPDPLNHGWREYGPRVGVWRLVEIFDGLGLQPTAVINSEVLDRHPAIVEEGVKRGWSWVAHGRNNSTRQTHMTIEEERAYITEVADRIERGTGARPRGWLGPALTASPATNDLLAEIGFRYSLDWGVDDEPFRFDVPAGELISVPYSTELNDIPFYALQGQSGSDFKQALVDQFDRLRAEGETRPRVMGFGLHPFLSGQPYRARYVAEALEHMARFDDVWFTSADAIADWYAGEAR
ncbi:polysaccharide deacetylase family protein [Streptomyces sp. NPDC050560]|uniref:polysaccharide deacetylase family protein n=1 Tax=Streptomyces sp. NPDC050560 TaxID=3365630 RepID=UPI0037A4795A